MIHEPKTCGDCGTEISSARLSCPSCGWLLHSARLTELAASAEVAAGEGDAVAELENWNEALLLLPPGSRQYLVILDKVTQLNRQVVERSPRARPKAKSASSQSRTRSQRLLFGLGALGLFVITKGKFLLAGFTKVGPLLSMLVSFGAYWSLWGWKFAAGLILSIYVHEMGHLAAFRRFGIKAEAPMFIPGFGAYVRGRHSFGDPRVDARIALAGPNWGFAAAVICAVVYFATGSKLFAALTHIGAWINLLNLLPVWQLDGARVFAALTSQQRLFCAISYLGLSWAYSKSLFPNIEQAFDFTLLAIAIVAGVVSFRRGAPSPGDRGAVVNYVILGLVLGALNAFIKGA